MQFSKASHKLQVLVGNHTYSCVFRQNSYLICYGTCVHTAKVDAKEKAALSNIMIYGSGDGDDAGALLVPGRRDFAEMSVIMRVDDEVRVECVKRNE